MTTIAHLLDDTNVGGVTRGLADHMAHMGPAFRPRECVVDTDSSRAPYFPDDVVIVHFTMSWAKLPFLVSLRLQQSKRPLVIVEHTYTEQYERLCVPNTRRFRMMLKLSYRLADVVVAVSEGQARWLVSSGCVPASKIVVIRSARDLSALHTLPLPCRSLGPLRLAAYGRYCEQKGFEVLIEAMHQLPAGTATLTMAGYGPLEQSLRAAAASVPSVQVQGPIGDLREFLVCHDAVVLPSRWEAFGIVAAEARSAARTLIISDIDGLSEQVDASYGIAVPPDNPERLARAIVALADLDIATMGHAARASARDQFEIHIQRWRQLICGLDRPVQTVHELSPIGIRSDAL